MHEQFQNVLDRLVERSGVGQEVFGEVLARTSLMAPAETSRVQIAAGNPAARRPVDQRAIPQGTVSKAVKALLEEGLLEDGEKALRNQDGRALSSLRLGTSFVIAGVHVRQQLGSPSEVTTALVGLDGSRIVGTQHGVLPQGADNGWDEVATLVHRQVSSLMRKADQAQARDGLSALTLFGVGVEVGAPVRNGLVLPLRGRASQSSVDVGAVLRGQFEDYDQAVPIVIENDVNALAVLAMHASHYAEPDLVVVSVFDEGVGGGLVLDGRLRRGGNGQAMEIGHLSIGFPPGTIHHPAGHDIVPDADGHRRDDRASDASAETCPCGQPGHVDALATPCRIRAQLAAGSLAEAGQLPAHESDGSQTRAYEVFAGAGAALGRAIAHVSNTVNPSRLILHLPPALAKPAPETAAAGYLEAARREITAAFAAADDSTYLTVEDLPADEAGVAKLGARAAAVCVLESFIEHALRLDGCSFGVRRTSTRSTSAA